MRSTTYLTAAACTAAVPAVTGLSPATAAPAAPAKPLAEDTADFNGDGFADLLIGASYETGDDAATTAHAGALTVLRGSKTGITTTGAKTLTQNTVGIPSASENEDHFGSAIAAIDTDKNGKPEVYVGGNGEDGYTGRVWNLATAPATGLTGTGATRFGLTHLGGAAGASTFGYRFEG
ncbi:FG-GAP repeat protein [Streptomyces sp. NPDC002886]|uniref:FG-GAP repeat protein n=1 Tax=Streptomyces sp. NPDC002886 TaxID=3364667 RepID=UPI0036B0814D